MIYNLAHDGIKLITFTIDGVTYQAEPGMTWEEWVNSKYNTIGAYIFQKGVYVKRDSAYPHIDTSPYGSSNPPKNTTEIISGGTYYVTSEIS